MAKTTIKSLKDEIARLEKLAISLREGLLQYSYNVRNLPVKNAFGVVAYKENSTPQVANTLNAAEILTIVLTAQQLGKRVVVTAGSDPRKQATNLDRVIFSFVDQVPDLPFELRSL